MGITPAGSSRLNLRSVDGKLCCNVPSWMGEGRDVKLHCIFVGVDRYRDRRIAGLRCAAADALRFGALVPEAIEPSELSLLCLTNEDATRPRILPRSAWTSCREPRGFQNRKPSWRPDVFGGLRRSSSGLGRRVACHAGRRSDGSRPDRSTQPAAAWVVTAHCASVCSLHRPCCQVGRSGSPSLLRSDLAPCVVLPFVISSLGVAGLVGGRCRVGRRRRGG